MVRRLSGLVLIASARLNASDMQRAALDGQGGFLDCLAQRGMGMADPPDVLGRGAEFDGGGQFGDQCAGVRAEHCAPSSRSVALSARILTNPSVSPIARARPLAVKGNFPTV